MVVKMIKICDKCKSEVNDNAVYCDNCGALLDDDWGNAFDELSKFEENDILVDFEYKKNPRGQIIIVKLLDQYAQEVTIPDCVLVIGDNCFENTNITKVNIPEGVEIIGKRAFYGCKYLENIKIPKSVKFIGDEAFYGCKKLDVFIPRNVLVLGDNALDGTLTAYNKSYVESIILEKKYKQGIKLFNEGKFADAIPLLKYGIDKGLSEAYEKTAYSYQNLGKWQEAIDNYKIACEMGNAWAQYRFALCYLRGNGVLKDLNEAFKYFKMSAAQDNSYACAYLSECYKYGWGTDKNYKEAMNAALKGANLGNTLSQLFYGDFFYTGVGCEKDYDEAIKWFMLAAEKNNTEAQFLLGEIYNSRKDYKNAVIWYEKAALKGHAKAQYSLGYIYKNGLLGSIDLVKAFNYFKAAANNSRYQAMFDLADCYEFGKGTEINKDEALKWYIKASKSGLSYMEEYLARIYLNGNLGEKNLNEAFRLFKEAALKGRVSAMHSLADCYFNGRGTPKDDKLAYEWYKKSADLNYGSAQWQVSKLLFDGVGVEVNNELALDYLHKAANNNNVYACDNLRWRYATGSLVLKDYALAFKWALKRLELKRDDWALCIVADYYDNGKGVTKDEEEAYKLYLEAANMNNANAIYHVGFFHLKGKAGLPVNKILAIEWLMKANNLGNKSAENLLKTIN